MIRDVYTEVCKFRSFADEKLDLSPELPFLWESKNCMLDPKTGLIFDIKTNTPSFISKSTTISNNRGHQKSWIRSTADYSQESVKQKELAERLILLDEYIKDISAYEIKTLPSNFVYVNLCTGTKYAYGHALELVLRVMNLPKNLKNVCFLISDISGITDIHFLLKTLSLYEDASFKTLAPNDKCLYLASCIIELKQTNGMCNFANKEEYNSFLTRITGKFDPNSITHKNVFLTRVSPLKRHVINFSDIEPMLKEAGVCILYGNEPFIKRAQILSEATNIAGYHGALFLDTCFSNESATILEYAPVARPAKCFLRMYKRCQNYFMKFIESNTDLNVSLDLDELQEFYNL